MELRDRALATSASALASGALAPIPTDTRTVVDDGIPFQVCVVRSLERKPRAPGPVDPFLDPEPALTVGDHPPAHRLVLNKFPVVPGHLLLVTRAFAEQDAPLGEDDARAIQAMLEAEDAVVFFNGGAGAGASQRHRHLQAVWPPLGEGPGRFPTEARLFAGDLPVRVHVAPRPPTPEALLRVLGEGAVALGLGPGVPYNLLVTRDAVALVPRRAERGAGVSVNALGFAGSLLVKDEAGLETVRRIGPMAILREAGVPR